MKPAGVRRWSLQARIVVLTGFITTSVLVLMAWLTADRSAIEVERVMSERSLQALQRFTTQLQQVPESGIPFEIVLQVREMLELEPSIERIDIFASGEEGLELIATSSAQSIRQPIPGELKALSEMRIRSFVVEQEDVRRLYNVHPFHFADGRPGFMTIMNSLDLVDSLLATHSRIGLFLMAITIVLLVGGIAWLFQTSVTRNVDELTGVMERFAKGRSDARAVENYPAEFSALAFRLNEMLAEIERLNQHMQEQIDAATGELETRNQQLELINLELLEAQKRRLQAERLALVGQLTASFAHDIGSPLGAVSTHLQLILEDDELSADARKRLKLATDQIDRVCGIVESLLSTTRARSKKEEIDVQTSIDKVVQLLAPSLAQRHITCGVDMVSSNGHMLVRGDPNQLQQVFLNLLNNALDAVKPGGHIKVRVDTPQPESPEEAPMLRIEVKDDGVGIPEDNLESIFEPFFTSKQQVEGTGLGLAVSQEIVRRHGGRISVESKVGVGTSFTVLLPLISGTNNGNRIG